MHPIKVKTLIQFYFDKSISHLNPFRWVAWRNFSIYFIKTSSGVNHIKSSYVYTGLHK